MPRRDVRGESSALLGDGLAEHNTVDLLGFRNLSWASRRHPDDRGLRAQWPSLWRARQWRSRALGGKDVPTLWVVVAPVPEDRDRRWVVEQTPRHCVLGSDQPGVGEVRTTAQGWSSRERDRVLTAVGSTQRCARIVRFLIMR
jgi:hypothetical protein